MVVLIKVLVDSHATGCKTQQLNMTVHLKSSSVCARLNDLVVLLEVCSQMYAEPVNEVAGAVSQ
jgi:hypothetical protein